jgi:hypothetical protein
MSSDIVFSLETVHYPLHLPLYGGPLSCNAAELPHLLSCTAEMCGCIVTASTSALVQKHQGGSLVWTPACLCQHGQCAAAACCYHVQAAVLACCSFGVLSTCSLWRRAVMWAVISRFYCWQHLHLEYKNSGKRGVWLAPAHLTLCLSAELLLVFR